MPNTIMNANRIGRQLILLLASGLLATGTLPATTWAAGWHDHEVVQLNGKAAPIRLPAESQIMTESWNRIVRGPYLVFMPEKQRLLMMVSCDVPLVPFLLDSDDFGKTWSSPRRMPLDEEEDRKTGFGVSLTYLDQGRVLCSVEYGRRYFSEDYGQTWSDSLPTPPGPDNQTLFQWDPYLVDRDPQTGQVTRIWETGYDVESGHHTPRAFIRSSGDAGHTWTQPVQVHAWKDTNEVALFRAQNGDILAGCRTRARNFDLSRPWTDHHAGLGISISPDNGETWSELNILYNWGRHHPSLVLLPDGHLVMTYVVRKGYVKTKDGYPQYGIEAVISRDHGKTWDLDHKFILSSWKANRKDDFSWWAACQSTSSVLLPDGSILTVFGTGFRTHDQVGTDPTKPFPRDIGLVKWPVNEKGLNNETTIADAPLDSDLRNVFDPNLPE